MEISWELDMLGHEFKSFQKGIQPSWKLHMTIFWQPHLLILLPKRLNGKCHDIVYPELKIMCQDIVYPG